MAPGRARWLVGGLVAIGLLQLAVSTALDLWLVREGYGDELDTILDPFVWPLVAGFLAAGAVGAVVANQQPSNPVGWLFLGLAGAIILSATVDQWYSFALVVEPSRIGGGDVAGLIGDKTFIPWFTLVTFILLLTPTGTFLSPRWRRVAQLTLGAAVAAVVLSVVREGPLDEYPLAENPFVVPALNPAADYLAYGALLLVAACLILSGVSLVLRFRRAEGDAHRQLLWLALVVVPLPAYVTVAFVAAYSGNNALTIVATGGFITLVPIAAGLSVLRYRLYDVERVVAATLTYSLVTAVLVAVYAVVVWLGAHVGAAWSPSPVAAATTGAVAAALVASPLRRALQDGVDRRFNRRTYDASQVVRSAVADSRAGLDPEDLLRRAVGDPTLAIAYPGPGGWVGGAGEPAPTPEEHVEVTRGDRVVARIGYDPRRVDRTTVVHVGRIAAAELDNTRLRAELGQRLVEIAASRRRLSQAHREERRRIERDLHDGAQQSLLALAFELQAAQLNGDPGAMRAALVHGAGEARRAAQELRDLANGLHPAALVDGGLAGVVDDLARRSPVPIEVDVDGARFDAAAEFTAWLVVAEAVTNAHKHAQARRIQVLSARGSDGVLRLLVSDDGHGGADPTGSGLRGLHDRVESAGGTLEVRSNQDGTTVEVTLPCGS